ncbi:phosphoribosylamine--glycine ligase [Faecalibaculum rodentium]|uniref:Phosphoribosylamine--glycine ligase n=1 Tax=Faecalibaculum rodentium TaxID=1702221 RepID=A0A1Q9YHK5_9FIRM|nr:phosphoribosylamine--glycine ligase [Faecalibaculum rodentium]OLU43636.1 phosphoribosylamine--glycine ligase [Faecalibaculum rodentium]
MKILVIGRGGREHALAAALAASEQCTQLFCAPGNPGMARLGTIVPVGDSDVEAMTAFAVQEGINLAVIGPESALAAGMADALTEAGIRVFGPTQAAAQVESSKDFAKRIMEKYHIPTAAYRTFDTVEAARAWVKEQGAPIVIKEDGLKAGKGVTVAMDLDTALEALDAAFAQEGSRVVIEEYLEGFEYSLIALVHEGLVVPLETAQDHKRVGDGDTGPNTGGMGSYSPVRRITPEILEETMKTVMEPMAQALVQEGVPFTGFLYGGLMLTKDGIKVIEFNARFGDPEAEVILPRLKSDFVDAILSVMDGQPVQLQWTPKTCHGVVLASEGYPAGSTKGALIEIGDTDASIFHMGTRSTDQGLKTDGGRVLMVVTLEDTLEQAFEHTYREAEKIGCDKLFYRTDIGRKDMA